MTQRYVERSLAKHTCMAVQAGIISSSATVGLILYRTSSHLILKRVSFTSKTMAFTEFMTATCTWARSHCSLCLGPTRAES